MNMVYILPWFVNLCKFPFAPKARKVERSSEVCEISLEDISEKLTLEVFPIFRDIPAIPPGPWGSGELWPWLCTILLTLLKASTRFGQVVLQYFLDHHISRLDRDWTKEADGGRERSCPCPRCGSLVWTYDGKEACKKEYKSLFGLVTLWRHKASCLRCSLSFHPLDSILGLGRSKMFPALQQACAFLGAHLTPANASKVLQMLTSIYVCSNTIAQRTKELGQSAIARQESEGMALEVQQLQKIAADADRPIDLHACMDGMMVPHNEKPKSEDGSHKEAYMVTISLKDTLGNFLGRLAFARQSVLPVFLSCVSQWLEESRLMIPNLRRMYLHGDGARWIESFAKVHPFLIFLLDWYHLKQNLWSLSRVMGKKKATAYRRKAIKAVEDSLWNGKVSQAIQQLKTMRFNVQRHQEERDRIVNYIQNRKNYIRNYKWFFERSITIGSGEVEGAQKHLISDRLKCSGMRWAQHGSDSVIAARCTIYNETWVYDLLQANLTRKTHEVTPQTM